MKQTRTSSIIKGSALVLACFCIFQLYMYYYTRVEREGFTQLLYSRIRPQARSVRLLYEDTIGNALKHIDRVYYNLGKR